MKKTIYTLAFAAIAACSPQSEEQMKSTPIMNTYVADSHSFGKPNEVAISHLNLDIEVDFESKRIAGSATYDLERNAGNTLLLDIRGLVIDSVHDAAGKKLVFKTIPGNERGDGLEIILRDSTEKVAVHYRTSRDAAALLWMEPEQTLGGESPFLFTQGQAILTRSWIPIQDSPALRITYEAKVKVPEGLIALMSATNPQRKSADGVYEFEMELPVPPYLLALAVGDLEFRPLGNRTGVYAEQQLVEAAAYEFADVEKMLEAAEDLYGPYRWGRYDLLVLPPSFPFGGMENPRLTFATPTIIAGDRSLTSLVAHELAHSWSGNLVTNATWNDFWLNEGFTVYFEKRIMEALYGKEYAAMADVLGYEDLQHTMEELGATNADTELKLTLEGRDPDDGMTDVAYEKGYLFLRWLEEIYGREAFDAFLKKYFEEHAFQTMTTDKFISYLDSNLLLQRSPRPDIEAWIFKPGLPSDHPRFTSSRFERVDSSYQAWNKGMLKLTDLDTSNWSSHEWLRFLRRLNTETTLEQMKALDKKFDFSNSGNSELAAAWYLQSIHVNYKPAFEPMRAFLMRVGRRKFIGPMYTALAKDSANKVFAEEVYRQARSNYHSVATQTIDEILLKPQSRNTAK